MDRHVNTKRLTTLISAALILLCVGNACHAQLFGGGLLGGGGGGLLGGGPRLGGGPAFGGGPRLGGGPVLGGGRPILGGGPPRIRGPILGGGAPIVRPSRPIAAPMPARPRPILGGGRRPVLGGRGPIAAGRPIRNRPIVGGRPAANRPGINRPIAGNLPNNRPALDRPALGRPGVGNRPIGGGLPAVANRPIIERPNLPGVVRPSRPVDRGRLDDFLSGRDRPAASQLPSPPVGGGDPPNLPDRPGIGGGDLPSVGDRPIIDRPIMPQFGQGILGDEIRKEIVGRRVERAVRVRDRVRELYYRENHPFMYWRAYMWKNHPVWSWWRVTAPYRWANWSSVTSWCGYTDSYAQPVSYEYTDEGAYADGKEVVVDDDYSQQARELAAAGAQLLQQKIDAQEADKIEWLPLGVYAMCKSTDGDPTMFVQLTISREGIVAGSFANTTNNENLSLQGGADRESSRLAFTLGDQDDVVVETGLYNVTEEQSSALVHYQDGTRENWVLVKLPEPDLQAASK